MSPARDAFSDQFEPANDGFIYRRRHKGAPIRISRDELDVFLERFDEFYRWLLWGSMVAGAVVVCPIIFALIVVEGDIPWWQTALLLAAAVGVLLFISNWMWNAPARALKGRPACGEPYATAKALRLTYARYPYQRMGLNLILLPLALVVFPTARTDPVWLAIITGGLAFTLFHIARKWWAERATV